MHANKHIGCSLDAFLRENFSVEELQEIEEAASRKIKMIREDQERKLGADKHNNPGNIA